MSLSNLVQYPSKRVFLPQSKKILNVRPFTGGEQKNLKYGLESNDKATIAGTLKRVLEACVEEKIKITKLSTIDIEYLFVQMIIMSSGPVIENSYLCENTVDGNKCMNKMDVEFDLNKVDFDVPEGDENETTKTFDIVDNIKATFKRADNAKIFDYFASAFLDQEEELVKEEDLILPNALVKVYVGEDEIPEDEDDPLADRIAFIDSIDAMTLKEIANFVTNNHESSITREFKCTKCGFDHTVTVKGIESFLV